VSHCVVRQTETPPGRPQDFCGAQPLPPIRGYDRLYSQGLLGRAGADCAVLDQLFGSWLGMPSCCIWSDGHLFCTSFSPVELHSWEGLFCSQDCMSLLCGAALCLLSVWPSEPGIPGQPGVWLWVAVSTLSLPAKAPCERESYPRAHFAAAVYLRSPTSPKPHSTPSIHTKRIFRGEEPQSSASVIYNVFQCNQKW